MSVANWRILTTSSLGGYGAAWKPPAESRSFIPHDRPRGPPLKSQADGGSVEVAAVSLGPVQRTGPWSGQPAPGGTRAAEAPTNIFLLRPRRPPRPLNGSS